jgi:hypothetical protein
VNDFAYAVCLERYTASVQGRPPETAEYRSTHVFRRSRAGGAPSTGTPIDNLPPNDLSPMDLAATADPVPSPEPNSARPPCVTLC